jgi:lysophospholipid acyltransferase (LPLAT)-like uncharacterized protein
VPREPRGRAWARALGTAVGPLLLRASSAATRVEIIHAEREKDALSSHHCAIYAFWHGRMWLLAPRLRSRGAAVLVSLSADGEVIAGILGRLGYRLARGSSSRGGAGGLLELEGHLRAGRSVALTPDGPRGPRHRAQFGAVSLAAASGKPILPLAAAARGAWTLSSWDSFQIPWPGTRGVIVFGEPMEVPRDGDLEGWRVRLEETLNAVEAEADREVGR